MNTKRFPPGLTGLATTPRSLRDVVDPSLLAPASAAAIAAAAGALVASGAPLLALGLVLGLAYLALVLARPEATALGLIAVLPFMVYPATVGGLSLFLALPLFGLCSLVLLLRSPSGAGRAVGRLPSRWFLLLAGIGLATSLVSIDPTRALSRMAYLLLFAIFAWALAANLAAERISRQALIRAVVLSGVLAGAAITIQFLLQFAIGQEPVLDWLRNVLTLFGGEGAGSRNWLIENPDVLRGIFPFMTPPSAGQYLMLTLLAAVWLKREDYDRAAGSRGFETAAVLLIGLALLFTFSRQSWVGAALGLVALALIHRPAWILGIGVALLLVFASPIPGSDQSFGSYLFSSSDTTTRSTSGRIAFWEEAIELIPANAVIGAGPGLFYTQTRDPTNQAAYAHNVFLDATVELGIVGALALVAVLALALIRSIQRGRQLAAAMLVAFAGASMFDDVLFFPRNGLLLAVAFALLAGPPLRSVLGSSDESSPSTCSQPQASSERAAAAAAA